jgi:hypothetical protein
LDITISPRRTIVITIGPLLPWSIGDIVAFASGVQMPAA